MKRLMAVATLMAVMPALASAQSRDHPSNGQGYLFFGLGNADSGFPVVKHAGAGGEFLGKGFGFGGEVGYARWGGNGADAWIASVDFSYHFRPSAPRGKVDPFMLAGGTFFAPTAKGNGRGLPGANFGGGVNIWLAERAGLRLEVRDHVDMGTSWGPPAPAHHYVSFRVGVTFR